MAVGNAVAGVICADGHLGYAQPVGGVIAYEKQTSISGVGFDIGCGNMAVRLDAPFVAIQDRVGPILTDIRKIISFGIGRTNEERVEHELFDDADAWRGEVMLACSCPVFIAGDTAQRSPKRTDPQQNELGRMHHTRDHAINELAGVFAKPASC